jgi:hypothetical protein
MAKNSGVCQQATDKGGKVGKQAHNVRFKRSCQLVNSARSLAGTIARMDVSICGGERDCGPACW